jgi:hypothetical protein
VNLAICIRLHDLLCNSAYGQELSVSTVEAVRDRNWFCTIQFVVIAKSPDQRRRKVERCRDVLCTWLLLKHRSNTSKSLQVLDFVFVFKYTLKCCFRHRQSVVTLLYGHI